MKDIGIALRVIALWLPLAFVATVCIGFAYVALQQDLRQGANDPQIQLAEDTAYALEHGGEIDALIPQGKTDIATSVAPWVAVYAADGAPLRASGELNGAPPTLPNGLFDTNTWLSQKTYASPAGDETRITWQSASGIRQAVVLVKMRNGASGFVAAGRSLREVEGRESQLTLFAALAWLASVFGSLIVVALIDLLARGLRISTGAH